MAVFNVGKERSHPRTCAITRSINPEGQTNQPTNLARRLLVPVSPLLSTEELIIFSGSKLFWDLRNL